MKHVHVARTVAVLALLTASACSEEGRGTGAAAVGAGSCEGFCGEQAPSGCYCDATCAREGDCCPDAEQVCTFEHACDDDGNADGGDGGDDGGQPPPSGNHVCFPGADGSGNTCFPVVSADPYTYPSSSSSNYREPIRWFDVQNLDLTKKLTPNFKFSEICVPHKGRYQVVQPHAIKKMQQVRDQAGALRVNSGFRSPPYNSQVGGATRSRHMYGDAFDVVPLNTSQNNLYNICNNLGAGYTAKYNSGHVHCDWRNVNVDTTFYGSLATSDEHPPYFSLGDFRAEIVVEAGVFSVIADGYDKNEGDLLNEWTALDADSNVLAESTELVFVPPVETKTVTVLVGGLAELEATL